MGDIQEELIKEAAKFKKDRQKTKYVYKLFIWLVIAVIYTSIVCYLYAKVNEVIGFYNGFIFFVLLILNFINTLNITYAKSSKAKKIFFLILYLTTVSIYFVPVCNFNILKEIVFKIFCLLTIFLTIMVISEDTVFFIGFMIYFFILNKLEIIPYFSIFELEVGIGIAFYLFRKINLLVKNQNQTTETLVNKFYSYFVIVYTLFVAICASQL